ncbi:hypothetical protein IAD21_03680 [Abditibacteriota bacterium]|nr:hypothetical protein IAD21_03680 [Abditibacteriota bacterium]
MADEFVDFYEALELPLEADRKEVRKRINEVYLEAQRNLDHRNFQTRVKHQEMFEVVLPRARYILLDDGRRDEYDRLVRAFRAASAPAPVVQPAPTPAKAPEEKAFGRGDASGFRLAEADETPAGKAPPVEALPGTPLDPAQMALQRDEMWAKWKQGLESAIARDEMEPKPAKSTPFRPDTATAAPQPRTPAPTPQENTESAPQRRPRPQASSISFNFGDNNSSSDEDDEQTAKAKAFEIERQKTERKRAVMKEILDSVGLKGTIMGGLGAAIPLGALLVYLMGRYYPREGAPQLPIPSSLAWILGLAIICGAAYIAGNELSKSMRRQTSMQLSILSLEDLLRKVGRTY